MSLLMTISVALETFFRCLGRTLTTDGWCRVLFSLLQGGKDAAAMPPTQTQHHTYGNQH